MTGVEWRSHCVRSQHAQHDYGHIHVCLVLPSKWSSKARLTCYLPILLNWFLQSLTEVKDYMDIKEGACRVLQSVVQCMAHHPCCGACPSDPCLAALDRELAQAPGTVPQHSHVSMPALHSPADRAVLITISDKATQAGRGHARERVSVVPGRHTWALQ